MLTTTVTTTYDGSSIETERVVNGQAQTRTETKNALGKVEAVTDSYGATISYTYDADGNLRATLDPAGNQIQIDYDSRGRKISTTDPDLGSWLYTFDGFGDLVLQTDAKSQTFEMLYDPLGRMVRKINGATGNESQWLYDVAGGAGVGKLAAMVGEPDSKLNGACTIPSGFTVTGGQRVVKYFTYTAFGDVQFVSECGDGDTFVTAYEYDPLGRQSIVRYPAVHGSQLAVGYHYTSGGFLQYLTDESSDYSVLWQAKAMNILGQVTDEQMRNGVETVANRNPLTGWLVGSTSTAHANGSTVIQNGNYAFDEIGNLLGRARGDAASGAQSQEFFAYDLLNRVVASEVKQPTTSPIYDVSQTFNYDGLGNLTQKGGSAYTYSSGCLAAGPGAGSRPAGPHAVCTVGGGSKFGYDLNGNMTSSGSRSVDYNASNKPIHIVSDPMPSQGNDTGTVDFMYGADQNRVVQLVTSGTTTSRTVYIGLGGTGKSMYERTTQTTSQGTQQTTSISHVNLIYAGSAHGGSAFALRILADDGSAIASKYYSFDHLGSVTAMSDEIGRVASSSSAGVNATVFGYDAWGARRNPDGTAAPSASFNLQPGHREFTGHETIPDVGLVNMNGRVYDPVIGRFLSPDPTVQLVADLQSYSRYSYVLNNPLSYSDPTGFSSVAEAAGGSWLDRHSPSHWSAFTWFKVVGAAVGTAICVAGTYGACAVGIVAIAAMTAGASIAQGAPVGQTLEVTAIGLAVGFVTAGAGGEGWGGLVAAVIVGAWSGAMTAGLTSVATGRSLGGKDFLKSAAIGALSAAVSYGIARAAQVSMAARAEAQGSGGTGAEQTERAATSESQGDDAADVEGKTKKGPPGGDTHFKVHEASVTGTTRNGVVTSLKVGVGSVEVWTTYDPGVDPDAQSAYGRGTTDEDVAAGHTSLRWHEGSHVVDVRQFFDQNPLPLPEVEVGMSVGEFKAAIQDYQVQITNYSDRLQEFTHQQTDCVGVAMAGC